MADATEATESLVKKERGGPGSRSNRESLNQRHHAHLRLAAHGLARVVSLRRSFRPAPLERHAAAVRQSLYEISEEHQTASRQDGSGS